MDQTEKIRRLEAEVERLRHELGRRTPGHARRSAPNLPVVVHDSRRVALRAAALGLMLLFAGGAATVSLLTVLLRAGPDGLSQRVLALDMSYRLPVLGVLVIFALIFWVSRRWLTFTWFAMLASYLAFFAYFAERRDIVPLTGPAYFWATSAPLAALYLLVAANCISEVRRVGWGGLRVGLLACVNTVVFAYVMSVRISWTYPGFEPHFTLGFAGVLAVLAVFAETGGPHRNYLFQVFVAKAVVALTLASRRLLPGATFFPVVGLECVVLAVVYSCTGIIVTKALGLPLMLYAVTGAVLSVRLPGTVALFGFTAPAAWVCGLGLAAGLLATAWVYERFGRKVASHHRSVSGHWYLADSLVDLSPEAAAVLHATGACLVFVALVVFNEPGGAGHLPGVLATAAALLLVGGLLLRANTIAVSSVVLLMAAHIAFYFFLYLDLDALTREANPLASVAGIAALTFIAAVYWERYLSGDDGHPWEQVVPGSIPYLAATLMLAIALAEQVESTYAAPGGAVFGLALLGIGVGLRRHTLLVAGAGGLCFGAAGYAAGFRADAPGLWENWYALGSLAVLLGCFTLAERLLCYRQHRSSRQGQVVLSLVRSAFVAIAALSGGLAIYWGLPATHVTAGLLAHAGLGVLQAGLFRAPRYRWAALGVFLVAVFRLFETDRGHVSPLWFRNTAAVAAAVLLMLIAVWSLRRRRRDDLPDDPLTAEAAEDG